MTPPQKTQALIVHIDQDLEDIVPGFLENRRRDVQTIHSALAQNDLHAIYVIGHRMKGDGGGYGFDRISAIGAAMERAAEKQDCDMIRQQTAELTDFLARVTVVYQK
ncbi:MAG: Hpt domain-containing protein [Nitrospira sp.]|nr:Hpt domain-containing protein [Nitrospira sp.]